MPREPFTQPRGASGRFVNLDGSGPPPWSAVFRWAVVDRLAGRRRRSPDRAPIARVEPDVARLATPPAAGEPARITWLGHASFLLQLDRVSLLVDPVLRDTIVGGIQRNVGPGLPIESLPPIDAVLVTHVHYDHLDLPTLARVGAPVVAGLGVGRYLGGRVPAVSELSWWSSLEVGRVRVSFVPAQHWNRRGPFDPNAALWGGFVVEGRGASVYHAGDTALFDGFQEIGAAFAGLDAALLPIGAYDPAWFMERQHLNPEQALRAFQILGARTFVAMHFGTFKLTDEPLDEPPRRLFAERERLGIPADRVKVLPVGGSLEVLGGAAASREVAAREP
ncbi:MAG TPA: MBL fold metallo-hydrolase [Anaeromyxobacter sp.]|nr:MBL fold metallo-hydrolase [Anaeromyxobacter sp.]